MIDVKTIVHEIEQNDWDQVNIQWTPGSATVFSNKKPVEIYLQITNDPEDFLDLMDKKHCNELHQGFKWRADSLILAKQRGMELGKYYGCNEEPPSNYIDENERVYLAAHVVYRGVN